MCLSPYLGPPSCRISTIIVVYLHHKLAFSNGGNHEKATHKRPYKDAKGQWQHGSLSREQLEAVVEFSQEAIRSIDARRKSEAKAA